MSLKRALLASAGSLTLLGAVVGLSSAPASAHVSPTARVAQPNSPRSVAPTDPHGCPAHNWCMYTLPGYMGVQYSYSYNNNPHNTWLYVGNAQNDVAEAIDNNREFETGVAKNFPTNGQWACDQGAVSNLNSKSWPDGAPADTSISAIFFSTSGMQICPETW
jgi:hypothetical protein